MERDRWLIEASTAIADGRTIDWAALEIGATNQADRDLIARLKSVEQVTRGHLAAAAESSTRSGIELPELEKDAAPVTSWGPFTLVERVGRGTFGDVYRARDPHLDRPIALKLLRKPEPGHVNDSAVVEEARLMARVRHPNVVTVFGADRIDGRVGVWMEFVEGRTLEQELRAHGPLSPNDVAAIGVDLGSALAAVHDAGLLHRDLKAQNVMRDSRGRIVLTDFGAGRDVSLASDTTFDLAGTPLYIAPEVLAGEPASPQSEVYGLGVLLYHLATGSFPVTISGRTLQDLRAAHVRMRDTPRYFPTQFPVPLALIIQRAIDSDPKVRFQSATEMAAALRALAMAAPVPRVWVWRLKWLIAPSVIAGVVLGLFIGRRTPDRYQSEATIQVVPPQIVTDSVRPFNPPRFLDRLQAIQQTILSRTRLQHIIEEFNLYQEERKLLIAEEVVEHMRRDIKVTPQKDDSFTVAYSGRSPVTVMKVTEKLAAYFRDESQVEGERRAEGANSFIEAQVEELKKRLVDHYKQSAGLVDPAAKRVAQLEREALELAYSKALADSQRSKMQIDLERRQIGEQFNLLDQARLPEAPISPNRVQITGVGALAGLGLGLALAAIAAMSKPRATRPAG